jgi:hypothetical protein
MPHWHVDFTHHEHMKAAGLIRQEESERDNVLGKILGW